MEAYSLIILWITCSLLFLFALLQVQHYVFLVMVSGQNLISKLNVQWVWISMCTVWWKRQRKDGCNMTIVNPQPGKVLHVWTQDSWFCSDVEEAKAGAQQNKQFLLLVAFMLELCQLDCNTLMMHIDHISIFLWLFNVGIKFFKTIYWM